MTRIRHLLPSGQLKEFLLYVIVGGLATVVEWAVFWALTNPVHVHYLLATSLAFAISTFANWAFGRLLVFRRSRDSLLGEIASIYLASIVGLVLNLVIMLILVQGFAVGQMPAKVAATALVFIYNYLVRKLLIYREPTAQDSGPALQTDSSVNGGRQDIREDGAGAGMRTEGRSAD